MRQASQTRVNERVCPIHKIGNKGPRSVPVQCERRDAVGIWMWVWICLSAAICTRSCPCPGLCLCVGLSLSMYPSPTHLPTYLSVYLPLPSSESLTGVFGESRPLEYSQRPL